MVNAQQYINQLHPKEKRSKITKLNLVNKDLKGELSLEGFVNLEKLDCSKNGLTGLNLTDCPKITELFCGDNYLTELNLQNLTKLEILDIRNTNIDNILKHLPNLKNFYCSATEYGKRVKVVEQELNKCGKFRSTLKGNDYAPLLSK